MQRAYGVELESGITDCTVDTRIFKPSLGIKIVSWLKPAIPPTGGFCHSEPPGDLIIGISVYPCSGYYGSPVIIYLFKCVCRKQSSSK